MLPYFVVTMTSLLDHVGLPELGELLQAAQRLRHRLAGKQRRPGGHGDLADIEVAARIDREPVRREELPRPRAGERLVAEPRQHLALVVQHRDARPEIGRAAIEPVIGPDLADVADRAFARRHVEPARPVQVVPLRLELAVAVEHLHAMVLAIRHIDPAVGVAADIVRQVELPRLDARLAPRHQPLAVLVVFVHARIAVAVGDIDVAAAATAPCGCSG